MKKFLFNIVISIFLIFIIELVSFNFIYCDLYSSLLKLKNLVLKKAYEKPDFHFKFLTYDEDKEYSTFGAEFVTRDCKEISYNPLKKYIVFIGCSYTYGQGIKINKTFSAQVQALTKRRTFNMSALGNGFYNNWRRLVYLPSENYMTEQERNNVEFVVYTLMYNHILRTTDYEVSYYLKQK